MKPLVVFLAGVGQEAADWQKQVDRLGDSYPSLVFTVSELSGFDFSFDSAVAALHARILESGAESLVLVGLSLGGMIATCYAAMHPEKIKGLLLSGSQVKADPVVMGLQRGIMRLLPVRMLPLPEDLTKTQFMGILDAAAKADLREDLTNITVKTLVLCGSKDPFNIPAAKKIAATLPNAELRVVSGGGHELNTDNPEEFSRGVHDLLATAS